MEERMARQCQNKPQLRPVESNKQYKEVSLRREEAYSKAQ